MYIYIYILIYRYCICIYVSHDVGASKKHAPKTSVGTENIMMIDHWMIYRYHILHKSYRQHPLWQLKVVFFGRFGSVFVSVHRFV